jgi:hypothetical protein
MSQGRLKYVFFAILPVILLTGCQGRSNKEQISSYLSLHPDLEPDIRTGLCKGEPAWGMSFQELCLALNLDYDNRSRFGVGRIFKASDAEMWSVGYTLYYFGDGKLQSWGEFGSKIDWDSFHSHFPKQSKSEYLASNTQLEPAIRQAILNGVPAKGMRFQELCLALNISYDMRTRFCWGRLVKSSDGTEMWLIGRTLYNFGGDKLDSWVEFGPDFKFGK